MEEQEPDPRYVEGYNFGYLMAQFKPELAGKLVAQRENQSHYFKGFVSGKEQYDAEVREWTKSLTKGRARQNEQERGRER